MLLRTLCPLCIGFVFKCGGLVCLLQIERSARTTKANAAWLMTVLAGSLECARVPISAFNTKTKMASSGTHYHFKGRTAAPLFLRWWQGEEDE